MEGRPKMGNVDIEWSDVFEFLFEYNMRHIQKSNFLHFSILPPSHLLMKTRAFFHSNFQQYKAAIYFLLMLWNSTQLFRILQFDKTIYYISIFVEILLAIKS